MSEIELEPNSLYDYERYPLLNKGEVIWRIILIVILLIFSFFANIFNIAVMGQDLNYLNLISTPPFTNAMEKRHGKYANMIIPMRARGSWTICTILFVNVGC